MTILMIEGAVVCLPRTGRDLIPAFLNLDPLSPMTAERVTYINSELLSVRFTGELLIRTGLRSSYGETSSHSEKNFLIIAHWGSQLSIVESVAKLISALSSNF